MAEPSKRIEMKPGVYYRFINPEGSLGHRAPKVKMWKKIHKKDPLNSNERIPYFKIADVPYSANINGGESLRRYSSKGFRVLEACIVNNRKYLAQPMPDDWEEVNEAYNQRVREAAERIDPQKESIDRLVQLVEQLLTKEDKTTEDKQFIELMKEDIELRKKEINDRNKNVEDEKKSGKGPGKSNAKDGAPAAKANPGGAAKVTQ